MVGLGRCGRGALEEVDAGVLGALGGVVSLGFEDGLEGGVGGVVGARFADDPDGSPPDLPTRQNEPDKASKTKQASSQDPDEVTTHRPTAAKQRPWNPSPITPISSLRRFPHPLGMVARNRVAFRGGQTVTQGGVC